MANVQPQSPQGPLGQGQPQGQMFPSSQEDVENFATNTIKLIHKPETSDKILKTLREAPDIEEAVGKLSSMLLTRLLLAIKKSGKDVNQQFTIKMLALVIEEIFILIKADGLLKEKPNKEMLNRILQIAANNLDQMLQRVMQQEQQQKAYEKQGRPPPQGEQGPPQQEPPQGQAPSALGGM